MRLAFKLFKNEDQILTSIQRHDPILYRFNVSSVSYTHLDVYKRQPAYLMQMESIFL